ncbi:hypothetical protein JCM8097_009382 [Rhodosporidiobolus ruineniae]
MRLHRLLVAVSAVLAPFSHAQQLKTVGVSQSQYWAFSQPAAGYPQGFVDYTGLLSGDESALNQVWYSNKPGAIAYFRPGVKNIIAASLVGTHKSDRGAYSFVLLDRTTLNFLDKRVLDGSTQSGDTSLSTLSTFTGLDPNVEYDFAVANRHHPRVCLVVFHIIFLTPLNYYGNGYYRFKNYSLPNNDPESVYHARSYYDTGTIAQSVDCRPVQRYPPKPSLDLDRYRVYHRLWAVLLP